MTLILTCLTHDCIFQVSDRRLTSLASGGLIDDNRNKCIVYNGCSTLAYTGLAKLGGKYTDEWLADFLRQNWPTLEAALNGLRTSLDVTFHPFDTNYHHAVVAAGWEPDAGAGRATPYIAQVSNFHDDGFVRCTHPSRRFARMTRILDRDRRYVLEHTGVPLPLNDEEKALVASLMRSFTKRTVLRHAIVELLCRIMRVASVRSAAVGKGLLVVVLPKSCLDATDFVVAGGIPDTGGWSFHVPPDSTNAVQYAPHVVCGSQGSYDITVEYGREVIERHVAELEASYVNPNSHRALFLTHWEVVHAPNAPKGVSNELAVAQVVGAPLGSGTRDVTGLFGNHIPPVPNVVMCEYQADAAFLDRLEREAGAIEVCRKTIGSASGVASAEEKGQERLARIGEWLRDRGVAEDAITQLLNPRATSDEIDLRLLQWTRTLRKPGETEEIPSPHGTMIAVPGNPRKRENDRTTLAETMP